MIVRRLGIGVLLLTFACEGDPVPAPRGVSEAPEPSPNASLLPVPLTGASRSDRDEEGTAPIPSTPLVGDRELPLDRVSSLAGAPSTGVSFSLRFSSSSWARAVRLPQGASRGLDLSLAFEVLSFSNGLERLRVTFPEGGWLLPEGTELRARSDKLGHVLVWPDGRSYRVVPVGALLTLLLERRIDIMPRFAVPGSDGGAVRLAGARKGDFETPVGVLRLEPRASVHAGEPSGELVCRFMAELVRARVSELCVKAPLPGSGSLRLAQGSTLPLFIENFTARSDLVEKRMLVPPELPIWKPGEYPPGGLGPLESDDENALMRELGLSPDETGAVDRVGILNGRGVPVLLSIQDRPLRFLAPGERFVRRSRGPVSYRAQGLLGLGESAGGLIQPGTEVRLGSAPEIYPFGKGRPDESE